MPNIHFCMFAVLLWTEGVVLADLSRTLQYCCGLGREKALNPTKCETKSKLPIKNVQFDQQNICSFTIDLCCLQYLRDRACNSGKQAAKEKGICDKELRIDEDISFKYCCEACKLGTASGLEASSCELSNIPIGSPWNEAFTSCCADITRTSNQTSKVPTTLISKKEDLCSLYSTELCSHKCISVSGSYRCECYPGYSLMADGKSCGEDLNRCEKLNPCQHNCHDNGTSILCSCNEGYKLLLDNKSCGDTDECAVGLDNCKSLGLMCVNVIGSYKCVTSLSATITASPSSAIRNASDTIKRVSCLPGYKFDSKVNNCIDVNECDKFPCYRNEICINKLGSYECTCTTGFQKDRITGACVDINECQMNSHICDISTQRCDNTIGSYHCVRSVGCGTGYTFNSGSGHCEDDDECLLKTDNCKLLGSEWKCRNTRGSFRCEKMRCDSPNCESTLEPIKVGHHQCPLGFELSEQGTCADIDECKKTSSCNAGLQCINTVGSYRCMSPIICKDGSKLNETINQCVDIDECEEQPGVCEHDCINLWGSFACSCRPGFLLHQDNRSCVDFNECKMFKEKPLCAGTCVNIPGSYKCQCPDGYRLSDSGKWCQDIDECAMNSKCNLEEVCLNTHGSYRCNAIECPVNFEKDQNRKNRCIRAAYYCRYDPSEECLQTPLSYSFNYLSIPSNVSIPTTGLLELFNLRGPPDGFTGIDFSLKIVNVRAPSGVTRVEDDYFYLNRIAWNSVSITLRKSIPGPQDTELHLNMKMYSKGAFVGFNVCKLFIYVSQYEF